MISSVTNSESGMVLTVTGEVTVEEAGALKKALSDAMDAAVFTVDIDKVTKVDTSGLQLLLAAQKKGCRLAGRPDAVTEELARRGLETEVADVHAG